MFRAVIDRCVVCILVLASGGCVSPRYFVDRGHDAKDVFTCAVGVGVGAKVRIGPVAPALFINHDFAGLRAGAFFYGNDNPMELDVAAPFPIELRSWDNRMSFGYDVFRLDSFRQETENPKQSVPVRRGKDVFITNPLPWIAVGKHVSDYTQIEMAAGLGLTLRLGFNPGELLDFILGWFAVDIFGDDAAKEQESRDQPQNKH